MARRKSSFLKDLFDIGAGLPWWLGITLAAIAYLLLHHYALMHITIQTAPNQMGPMVVQQLIKTLAMYGQYFVPLMLLIGAATSFFSRRKRARLVDAVAANGAAERVRKLSWQDFELLVGEAFRKRGYRVDETGGGGADGGIDLKLHKDGETFYVQCKQWRAYKVSVNIVRELYGVMAAEGATGGFVVTSGIFTREAQVFAQGRNIELIDGKQLAAMIDKASSTIRPIASSATPLKKPRPIGDAADGGIEPEPSCPAAAA